MKRFKKVKEAFVLKKSGGRFGVLSEFPALNFVLVYILLLK